MKKGLIFIVFCMVLVLAACGTDSNKTAGKKSETITYKSEAGDIKVPANPKRVVVLSTYAGDVLNLGVKVVGADSWSMNNENFAKGLKGAKQVSDENIEEIIALKPDLILGLNTIKNQDKLKKIAPLVTFTYGKNNYLDQHVEIGKVLNKEKEAKAWVKDFKQRAEKIGAKIKAKIGKDKTISVAENFDKQIYVFGDNWGRGTEILYQTMGLKMPETVKKASAKSGYYAVSVEQLGNYTGDYMVLSKYEDSDTSFMKTSAYTNIPAVKNNHVLEVDANKFYFNDALTLDYQLKTFEDYFLGN
ncbi:iron compound ABC transporter substrate-binding protein [Listeria floridensis FSL S10-1187]|uniref:Iron compound ABC transporter substrate-binding protein n=1 Tax=Listeria floridensis FSL S10-1187 TaxID=1265817 RepID=A0ABP3AYE8_9LIST|nr:iron-hydroxamate ABC transporter substrate-binding protein [Listeria floridensis]EUJ32011.1 iron compound ABC transporter substrate-binding protein [Listeria floridensis FSL S10-1187]